MILKLEDARVWIELLHSSSNGFLHVSSTGQWSGLVTESVTEALAYIKTIDLRQPAGIYLRATTIKNKLPPGSRGGAKDTRCFPGLWADLDIAGPGHKTEHTLPPSQEDAVRVITESGLPEPTLWIHSGGGLYPWWLLEKSHEIESEEDLEELQWLSTTWQDLIAHSAKQLGWFYGTEVKDLARVLRIPGTVNRKISNAPQQCHILENIGSGKQFDIHKLFEAAVTGLPKVQRPERSVPVEYHAPGPDGKSPGDALDEIPWDDARLLGRPGEAWEVHHQVGFTRYWTRPGKSRRDGYSATTGYDSDRDRIYVFSSSTPLPVEEPLNKFAVYAYLNHAGNFPAAAAELRRQGFGDRPMVEVAVPVAEPWEPPPSEPGATMQWGKFSWDDIGNGQRFAFRYHNQMRFLVDAESWAVCQQGVWSQVTEAPVNSLVQTLIDNLPQLESELYDNDPVVANNGKQMPSERDRFLSWVGKQRTDARISAMRRCASGRPELQARLEDFDQDPMLLSCRNGVLNLRTGMLAPANPELLFMQQANTTWDENATCPGWLEYLEKVMPDSEVRAYLQRITGYSLTGDVSERTMFLHHGGGDNGKSIYLDVIGTLLGSYSIAVAAETFMAKQFQSSHNADVARMAKRRFLRASETNVGKHLDEGQVKLLAGGDDLIVARYPYQRFPFEFRPTGKIHLATNHVPEVSDTDSIWRRLSLISWDVRVPRPEQNRYLTQQLLKTERAGILKWAMEGCLDWQRSGLGMPASLEALGMELRDNQSVIRQFIQDCVRDVDGGREIFSRIYLVYKNWCDTNGARPMSGKAFSMAMQERGYKRWRDMHAKGFQDIGVITPMQSEIGWQ